jgi:hypothetical protein
MEGTVRLFDGQTWTDAVKGDFLYVPMLILFAPGPPREDYFRELADVASSGRVMTDENWLELWARHDQYPA